MTRQDVCPTLITPILYLNPDPQNGQKNSPKPRTMSQQAIILETFGVQVTVNPAASATQATGSSREKRRLGGGKKFFAAQTEELWFEIRGFRV